MRTQIQSLNRRFSEAVREFPHKTAVANGKYSLTYRQLDQRADTIARFFTAHIPTPQEKVIILLDRSPLLVESLIGILKCGMVFVPLDPRMPPARLEKLVSEIGARWVVTTAAHYRDFKEVLDNGAKGDGCRVLLMEKDGEKPGTGLGGNEHLFTADQAPEGAPDTLPVDGKHCYIYFTSGSTGVPKGVLGRHKSLAHFIQWEIREFGVDSGFNISQLTNPSFDPFLRDIFVPLASGATLCIPDEDTLMNPAHLVRWLEENRITLIHTVPSLFKLLLSEIHDADCLEHLRYILLAGELIHGNDVRRFIDMFGERIQLVNIYGPTETTLAKFFHRIKPGDAGRPVIPVGKPIEGAQALVLDRNRKECREGKVGEVYIRTPFISSGYVNDSGLTKEVFVENPFSRNPRDIIYKTGDLGRWLPGGLLELSGRADNQVKIRGCRVELGEIENRLLAHKDIKEAVVIARETDGGSGGKDPHRGGEKSLMAYFVLRGNGSARPAEVNNRALREYLKTGLPDYMVPSRFIGLEKFPLNPNGKVDRRALAGMTAVRTGDEPGAAPPRTDVERVLVDIWAEVLQLDPQQIGIHDDFFELGGHSLRATRMLSGIAGQLQVNVPFSELFRIPVISKLAQYIDGREKEQVRGIEPAEEKEYYPLSSGQERLYVLQMMDKNSIGYNITNMAVLEGEPDVEGLENVFRELVLRHESLRTSFTEIGDDVVQRIHPGARPELEYHDAADRVDELLRRFIRPFDLSRAPLLRVGLFKKNAAEYVLAVDMHHIITDGTSNALFIREFMEVYGGRPLPPPVLQYKDFSQWRNRRAEQGLLKQQEDYWLKEFAGEVPVLDIPTDFPRPGVRDFSGRGLLFDIPRETAAHLKKIASSRGATLNMVLLSLYSVLLARISGRERMVIGIPIAGRRFEQLSRVIGMFVNTLAINCRPGADIPFDRFLGAVKDKTLEAFENQDYPFDDLVAALDIKREPGRSPLVQVGVVFQNFEVPSLSGPELTLKPYPYERRTAKLDLVLYASEGDGTIDCCLEYDTGLFKEETVRLMRDRFLVLIGSVTADPGGAIGDLEYRTEMEREWVEAADVEDVEFAF